MEMFRFNNTDKSGRNYRIGLAKKLAGILLAVVMMATNFGGIEPGVAHAVTEVNAEGDIIEDPNSTMKIVKGGSFKLNNSIYIPGVNGCTFHNVTTIDLNGYPFGVGLGDIDNRLNVVDNSTGGSGYIMMLLVLHNASLSVSSGQATIEENYGNISVSGGTVEILTNQGGTVTQTGGTVTIQNNNNGTYIQTGGYNPGVNKTITLYANGGTLATSTVTTVTVSGVEKLYSLPPAPTPPSAYHTFDGWYTSPDGGELVTTDTVFSYDSPIYAHWTVTSTPATNTSTPSNPSTTNNTDGVLAPETASVDSTKDYLDDLTEKLEDAIKSGDAQTIYWNEGTALPGPVMKLLQENPQITLVFSYTYEGLDYVVSIPGKNVKYDPNVPWCGPLYLYGLYGKYGTTTAPVTTTTQVGERSYTVISGETLWGIAMRLGTTVEELVRLNNITDPDRISIGQIIRY